MNRILFIYFYFQVERDICNIEPTYLCDKTILVNGSNNLTPSSMGLSFDELCNLKEKYRLHLLNGNIKVFLNILLCFKLLFVRCV